MSQLSLSLISFKKKIEEAVVLVPTMIAEEKLKAVQYWNVVSERLQEIVNNSAADINALAMRLEQEDIQQKECFTQNNHQISQQSEPRPESVPILDSITGSETSCDRQELYLPIISPDSQINSSSLLNNSNHNNSHFSHTIDNSSDQMDEHLATVITSYHDSHESHPDQEPHQMMSGFDKTSKSNQVFEPLNNQQINGCEKSLITNQTNGKCLSTTSVIQEVDQNMVTTHRRNVIQSTQRAMTELQVLDNNSINNYDNNDCNSDHINNDKVSEGVINSNIKIIVNDEESQGISSCGNNSFNDTSFDISYDSSDANDTKFDDKVPESENNSIEKTGIKPNGVKKKSNKKSSEKNNFECDVCHKQLPNNSALVTHKWVHSKPYSCCECDARFSTKGNLLVHQRRHTGEKPFACNQCTASFSTKGNLKRHIKAHSGERPWKCTQCDSRFTEKKSLKVHMRRHTGEKPYQCSVCGKAFSQTGVLQTHMALHLDERKHLCELCGKAFRQRSQLRLHVLRHEGVKRWDCSDCDAKFLTKGDLERHHRVHTGERPFVCDLCGKTFTRQQSLNEHSNRHYGLKPYSCTVCSKTFAEMSACYKHIKVHKKQQTLETKNESIIKSGKQTGSESNGHQTTRSQVNVIQSTTASMPDKGVVYIKQFNNKNEKQDLKNSFSESMDSNTNDKNLEFVDFTAINLLANASTAQQNF